MSPHVNNFVTDLVSMAKAMEELPVVRAELENARAENEALLSMLAERNGDLEQSRKYAASLEQKVHDAEVARDDAELSFLEADERTSRALDFVKALFGNAGALIQALEPPKAAAPQAEAPSLSGSSVSHEPVAAQLDSHPVGERESPLSGESLPNGSSSFGSTTSIESPSILGQRESNPTASTTVVQSNGATASGAETTISATAAEEPVAHGPYHGKRYVDLPQYIPLWMWIEGGGTDDGYWEDRENMRPTA